MAVLKANTSDGAKEKHVPVAERNGTALKVKVGEAEHPMLAEHYIKWIIAVQEGRVQRVVLSPGVLPEAEFILDSAEAPVVLYEYCNLHGLWTATV